MAYKEPLKQDSAVTAYPRATFSHIQDRAHCGGIHMADSTEAEIQIEQTEGRLALNGNWGVQQAKRLHDELRDAMACSEEGASLSTIDCTRIGTIDLAGIQLIMAAKDGQKVEIEVDSETSTAKWFGLCGVGKPDFDFDS